MDGVVKPSILDYIAVEAMKVLLTIHGGEERTVARKAYKQASEMLSEREQWVRKNPTHPPTSSS